MQPQGPLPAPDNQAYAPPVVPALLIASASDPPKRVGFLIGPSYLFSMKKKILVFEPRTKNVDSPTRESRLIDNAQLSGANGHKTDAIDY